MVPACVLVCCPQDWRVLCCGGAMCGWGIHTPPPTPPEGAFFCGGMPRMSPLFLHLPRSSSLLSFVRCFIFGLSRLLPRDDAEEAGTHARSWLAASATDVGQRIMRCSEQLSHARQQWSGAHTRQRGAGARACMPAAGWLQPDDDVLM